MTARRFVRSPMLAGFALCMLAACSDSSAPVLTDVSRIAKVGQINHVVVIYLENRSFDNLYGEFPGADGLVNARSSPLQVDASGAAYATLPQTADSRIPSGLPNAPFLIDTYLSPAVPTRDLSHSFYQEQQQINGGRMDKFVVISDALGLVMGHYRTAGLPLAAEAAKYTLLDHFFHGAYGGSFLNHIWLVAAATPVFPNAPAAAVAQLDANGNVVKYGFVTPDGYAVNTAFTVNAPHPASEPAANLLPNQTLPTIGDRLTDKGVSWAWYSGGWNNALAGRADPSFQFHHQPFAYFAKYADGTAAKAEHLRDETEFVASAKAGTLPAVSFIKPLGAFNEHPGYTDVVTGENHVLELIKAVREGPNWKDAAIIITYDENGGFWDHVSAPKLDRWGAGTRVPTLVISPFSRHGVVDHTPYETTSILTFIERRFGLAPLSTRDAASGDLSTAFDFTQTP